MRFLDQFDEGMKVMLQRIVSNLTYTYKYGYKKADLCEPLFVREESVADDDFMVSRFESSRRFENHKKPGLAPRPAR